MKSEAKRICVGQRPITHREVIRDDSDEALALTVDDTGRDDASSITAKAHAHREGLLAVGATATEEFVEIEGDTGEVPEVLEEGEEREEYRHRREHHRDDPYRGEVHAVDEEARQPPGTTPASKCGLEEGMERPDEDIAEE